MNRLADATGTPEPIHGPEAIQSVAFEAKTTPYTELKREDIVWYGLDTTNVESESFYFHADSVATKHVQARELRLGRSIHGMLGR